MIDFLYDSDSDLLIKDGDLVIGNVEKQAAKEVLLADKGWFGFDPSVGAGLISYLQDDIGSVSSLITIRKGLEADGISIQQLELTEQLKLEYSYGKRIYRSTIKFFANTGRLKNIQIYETQSVFDIALIHYGFIEAAFLIMDISAQKEFPPIFRRETIRIEIFNSTMDLYDTVSQDLATLLDAELQGIGYWRIGQDFIIS